VTVCSQSWGKTGKMVPLMIDTSVMSNLVDGVRLTEQVTGPPKRSRRKVPRGYVRLLGGSVVKKAAVVAVTTREGVKSEYSTFLGRDVDEVVTWTEVHMGSGLVVRDDAPQSAVEHALWGTL
jgi:hypothetical protein